MVYRYRPKKLHRYNLQYPQYYLIGMSRFISVIECLVLNNNKVLTENFTFVFFNAKESIHID